MALFKLPEDADPKPEYWIMEFPFYGKFVFFGTEAEAEKYFTKKLDWEGGTGIIRLADPDVREDRDFVVKEIQAVREDRAAGIQGLPFLPSKGWF